MCLGKPVFTGPMKQITAVRKCKYGICHLRYLLKADRDLRTALQSHIDMINTKKYDELFKVNQEVITTLDNTSPNEESTEAAISASLPSIIQPPLSTKTGDEINSALSLDLLLFPAHQD